LKIRRASESEAGLLSELAAQAKAHWGYSAAALADWTPQLTLSTTDIRARPVFVAIVDDDVAGFYSLAPADTSWELDNLWVLPRFMQRGVGRALLVHALETASSQGAVEVAVDSDPNAEGFYVACGAVRRGEVPAPIEGMPERVRPQLAFIGLPG
jgi:ribosomal protein S18 acetylase RimI-like enzyme